jgi:hypothetical protein
LTLASLPAVSGLASLSVDGMDGFDALTPILCCFPLVHVWCVTKMPV